ncbi:uncharacterized protein LOC112168376 isoform X1 [Rosa chinensis]|uniref:uncharacterized protein LOC112168376 isoform X1 n=1 Tax=Rosa chinensis TaxID=74649 RepID=UPI001AD91691|nr:uncharacterized protein LOC112168376 isoform X1 [Rosa chinensis]
MWNGLTPSSQKVLSLVAELKTLQKNNVTLEKDEEHLRINLLSAEEEVKLLFEENKVLDEANKRLLKQYRKERNNSGSDGKHTDVSTKVREREKNSFDCMFYYALILSLAFHVHEIVVGSNFMHSPLLQSNKRKSSSKVMSSSPIQGKIDFSDQESARQPLSPLRCNSPNSRLHKKQ